MVGELYKKLPGRVLARCLSPGEEIRRKINAKNISCLSPPSSTSVFQFQHLCLSVSALSLFCFSPSVPLFFFLLFSSSAPLFFFLFFSGSVPLSFFLQFMCCPFFSPKTFFFSPKQFSLQPKTFFSSTQNIFFQPKTFLFCCFTSLYLSKSSFFSNLK